MNTENSTNRKCTALFRNSVVDPLKGKSGSRSSSRSSCRIRNCHVKFHILYYYHIAWYENDTRKSRLWLITFCLEESCLFPRFLQGMNSSAYLLSLDATLEVWKEEWMWKNTWLVAQLELCILPLGPGLRGRHISFILFLSILQENRQPISNEQT